MSANPNHDAALEQARKVLNSEASTIAALEAAKSRLEQPLAEIDAELEERRSNRKRIVTSAGSATEIKKRLDSHDADVRALSYTAEIAAETKAQLETRIATQRESEAVREREENYRRAKAKRDEVAAIVVPELRRITSAGRSLLRKIAEAQVAVDKANASLPPGAEAILSVEHARRPPIIPPKIETRKIQIFIDDNNRRIADFGSVKAERQSDGKFEVFVPTGSSTGAAFSIHSCKIADFVEITTTNFSQGLIPLQIAQELSIPQTLFHEPPGWRPMEQPPFPGEVLNQLDLLENSPKPVPAVHEYVDRRLVRAEEHEKEQAVIAKDIAA